MLSAALVQVEYMQDHLLPKLMARSGHDLRLCIEARNKVLSAELKLRASLERRESRGNTYRTDYPYRRDNEYLCCLLAERTENGTVQFRSVPVKEEWAGDRAQAREKRFSWLFPGEEAAATEEGKA